MPTLTKDRHAHLALVEDPHTLDIERVHQWAARAAADVVAMRRRDAQRAQARRDANRSLNRKLRENGDPGRAPGQGWAARALRALQSLL